MSQQENPKTRTQKLMGWFESRTGYNLILKVSLDEPIPGGARWAYVFGSGLLFIFISQVITGICLALYYVPSAQSAHVSVAYISKRVAAGEFLRSLHVYGASAMIIVLALHFLQTFLWGAYKGRRELLWAAGGVLAILVLAMGFTGYLLPWEQKSYFATAVATNIVSTIPIVGQWMAHFMRGGDSIGTLTISRFYLLHVIVLPALLFAFIAVHIYLFRKAGAAGPVKEDPVNPTLPPESFYPKQVIMDLVFSLALVAGLGLIAFFHPAPLGPRANPASTTYIARPEWYYLPIFEWLKFWEGPKTIFGVVIIPGVLALLFFLLPFLDRKLERRPWRRPIPLLSVAILFSGLIFLGFLSKYQDAHNKAVSTQLAQQKKQEDAYMKTPFKPYFQGSSSLNLLAPTKYNPEVAHGKWLFHQNGCSSCHGSRGRGAVGPSLVGIGKKFDEAKLISIIHHPPASFKKAGMPGAPSLPIPQVKDLIAYLHALGTPEENEQPAATMKAAEKAGGKASGKAGSSASASGSASSASSGTSASAQPPNGGAHAVPAALSTSAKSKTGGGSSSLVSQGHHIFQTHTCTACHGPTAQGTAIAPPLAGIGHYISESTFSSLVHHPNAPMKAKGMPASTFSKQQTHALWTYLNSMKPPKHRGPGVPAPVPFGKHKAASAHHAAANHTVASAKPQPAAEAAAKTAPATAAPQQVAKTKAPAAPPSKPAPRQPSVQTVAKTTTPAGNVAKGKHIFQTHTCTACHGPTAQGTAIAPPLAGIGHYFSESLFSSLVHHPRPPMTAKGMPATPLSNQQTRDLWAYLNSMKPPKHRAPGVPAVVIFKPKTAKKAPQHPPAVASTHAAASAPKNEVKAAAPAPAKASVQKAALSGPAAAGRHIFETRGCTACHGSEGQGTRLAIRLIGITKKVPHDKLIALIRHPDAKMKAGGMPTFGFNNKQLNEVVAFLGTLKQPTPGAEKVTAAAVHHPHKLTAEELAGKKLYSQEGCSSCHGNGSMQGTAAAPSLTATASELPPSMLHHLLTHPSEAMRSHGMPPVSLNKSQMQQLIAFIRSLRYNR